jgi:hypothetical protein
MPTSPPASLPQSVRRVVHAGAAALLLLAAPAQAAPEHAPPAEGVWSFGMGRSGFRDARVAGHFALTYRHRPLISVARPSAGVLWSTAGSVFLFGGLGADVEPVPGWGVSPIATVGYYERGGDMNLGGALEFRSGLEIFRRLGPGTRVGVSIHHISNAGLFDRNPGRETLFLSWSFGR